MININLKIKPSKIYILPSGGWLVSENNGFVTNVVLVRSDGNVQFIGRGIIKYSPVLNQYILQGNSTKGSIIWSESGEVKTVVGGKFDLAKDSLHYANGYLACNGTDARNVGKEAERYKNRHRRLPKNLLYNTKCAISLLVSALPDFVVDAFVEGGKHKNSVFFLKVSTGERVSIEASGIDEIFDVMPSADGLTALAVDCFGNGVLIDNPLEK